MNENLRKELIAKLFKTNEHGYTYQDSEAKPDKELVDYYVKEHGLNADLHPSCISCQIRQLNKYTPIGKRGEFGVDCQGIPRALPKGAAAKLKQISVSKEIDLDRAKKLMLATIDPVAWAELMLGFDPKDTKWRLRSYQKEQLRCTAKRLVVREGRRSGKTFAMALKLLHHAFNTKITRGRDAEGNEVSMGPTIMVVTPYTAQITNIFDEMEKLIKRNVDLVESVTSGTGGNLFVKTPNYKMSFKNGAIIQGFVSGTTNKDDGSAGGTMRGQTLPGHTLVFMEDGSMKRIDEIKVGDIVVSTEGCRTTSGRVSYVFEPAEKEFLRAVTLSGRVFEGSVEHEFAGSSYSRSHRKRLIDSDRFELQWKTLEHWNVGDYIAVNKKLEHYDSEDFSSDEALSYRDIRLDRIVSIERVGVQTGYDISVSDTHNFLIEGGIVTHNSAHIIYIDEMDMIPETVLDKVITPILLTTPDTIMYATSTPIGKRGKFYNWCLERPDFKEDYLPSSVLPHWDKIKHEVQNDGTEESFAAEYMAEFVDFGFGVFRPSWIVDCKADYTYDQVDSPGFWHRMQVKDRADMIVAIGIDWNKNAGSEFYVVGYSPAHGQWWALEAVNIPQSEYSSKAWKEEVIRLNAKWKPDYIYADKGYGHTIIEDLHLHAHQIRSKPKKTLRDQQTVQLIDRLKAFDFWGTVELKDPIDGTEIKKRGKHFLVENAISIMENSRFRFAHNDSVLTKQMMNYTILKMNEKGQKTYGMVEQKIGDHRLDAWMLALAALTLEESVYSGGMLPFSKPTMLSKDILDARAQGEAGLDELEALKKAGMPGAIQVMRLLRSDGTPSGWKANEDNSREGSWGKPSRGSRGDLSPPTEGYSHIFEGLAKHSAHLSGDDEHPQQQIKGSPISTPARIGPRRRRKGGRRGNIRGR